MQVKDISLDKNTTKIFNILRSGDDNVLDWIIEETNLELIPYDEGHYLVAAKQVFVDKTEDCFINMSTPERNMDVVVRIEDGKFVSESFYNYLTKYKNEYVPAIIPAVASDCFGLYELYYSKENPQVGIDILKNGLLKSKTKNIIAEDLGYILSDENRVEEAIEAFLISEKYKPSTEYTYHELAGLYFKLGQTDKQLEYQAKYKQNGGIDDF